MKFKSIALAGAFALVGLVNSAEAQVVVTDPDGFTLLVQAPAPSAPMPPPAAMQDVIRLMASNGSYLGVGVRDVDAERKKALSLKEERGAEITSVADNSPAAKAGLKTGDVVLDYAGQRVESMEQFVRMVRETPAGREVKVAVSRGGSVTTLTAKPENGRASLERTMALAPMRTIEAPRWGYTMDTPKTAMFWSSGSLGVVAETLDSQLAEFFGVKQGVLVRSVAKGTPAEKAGIKAGDVIVKVDETKVESPRDVTNAVRTARGASKTIGLSVVREKKESTVKVTLDDETPAGFPTPRARSVGNKFQ